ncbi:MAG: peptidase S55 SpoIVB, partial [bacterium]
MNKKSIFIRGCAWLFVITVFFVLAVSESYARTGADTLPVAGIEAGMEGYGRTVFSGTRIDTFAVKVLGVLENVMPGQDLILIRAESDTLHHTNIMSGMSGSPIYIGGRLIGALAYGWSFGKDPIAGVTPIENILKSRQIEYSEPEGARRIVTPLIASGFSSAGLESLSENLRARGMPVEIMTGGSDKKEKTSAELEAGSAVGVQLVRGDLNLAAIGTVTHVDNEGRVYAFGHPFLNAGQIDFPMTAASVETTFASLQSSFKIASPLQPLGAITEDRQASIVGELGRQPEMIPVNVELSRPHQN